MNAKELEIMRSIVKKAIEKCEDFELLDLVYKLIVTSNDVTSNKSA